MSWPAAYIGMPFGEGPGQVTCWSLVVAVYRDQLRIDLPGYGEISALDLMRIARAMRDGSEPSETWQAVPAAREFDVALMRGPQGGQAVVHVGLVIDGARLLHVEAASHAVAVRLSHWSVRHRLAGFRRHACQF